MTSHAPSRSWLLGLALLAGLINALVYLFLVPPWQHYDEPNHFEYAWLIANRGRLPRPGDLDAHMRRQVAGSMAVHGFFRGSNFSPDLSPGAPPPSIGLYSQLDEPPLYYLAASAPLFLLRAASIDAQLYAARAVSLLFFLVAILASWGAARELAPQSEDLQVILPLSLALLPGLADLMTAVNNDAAAIALFSLFVWVGLRLLRRGFSWSASLALLSLAALSALVKSTALLSVPLAGVVLLFALLRGRQAWLAWGLLLLGGVAALLALLAWGDAAVWYRMTGQAAATRARLGDAPLGAQALQIEIPAGGDPARFALLQLLPSAQARQLSGKTLTLGAWVWASQPAGIRSPRLQLYPPERAFEQVWQVDQQPGFHAFQLSLSGETGRAWILLSPALQPPAAPLSVYFDGLVLVEGVFPLEEVPQFSNPSAVEGAWGGQPFRNLLRNASAETSGPRIRAWADLLSRRLFADPLSSQPSTALLTLFDWPGAGWYFRTSAAHLLRTFWARFGWGNVPLVGSRPYRVLAILTLLGVVGSFLVLLRSLRTGFRRVPWAVVAFLSLSVLAIAGVTLLRGANYLFQPRAVYIPVARYLYPAIIPLMALLDLGWLALLQPVAQLAGRMTAPWAYRLQRWAPLAVILVFFVALNLLSYFSLLQFYH